MQPTFVGVFRAQWVSVAMVVETQLYSLASNLSLREAGQLQSVGCLLLYCRSASGGRSVPWKLCVPTQRVSVSQCSDLPAFRYFVKSLSGGFCCNVGWWLPAALSTSAVTSDCRFGGRNNTFCRPWLHAGALSRRQGICRYVCASTVCYSRWCCLCRDMTRIVYFLSCGGPAKTPVPSWRFPKRWCGWGYAGTIIRSPLLCCT